MVTATVTNVEGAAAEAQFLSIKTSAIMSRFNFYKSNLTHNFLLNSTRIEDISIFRL